MHRFQNLLHNLFGKRNRQETAERVAADQKHADVAAGFRPERFPEALYKKGDFIGRKYEVYGVLGMGGCGVVYLVYSPETKSTYALKTFRDEYLEDLEARDRFRREAAIWVSLERHPYLVRAFFVEEISGRLYIAMEYIAPGEEGLNSLEAHLKRRPPDLAQSLRWAVQFCYGMEYAYSKGLRCHRDIKPGNVLLDHNKTVKISDFGLADVLRVSRTTRRMKLNLRQERIGLSGQPTGGIVGTPPWMAPEQFSAEAECDERSDIYSFGVVLFQMAADGRLPFLAPLSSDNSEQEEMCFWRAMYRLHNEFPVPKLNSALFPIICHCLEKKPGKRCPSFEALREDLEPLLRSVTGEIIKPPELKELEAWEWGNKAFSLRALGRFDEALQCDDRALELGLQSAKAWSNKGNNLRALGRFEEALRCDDRALQVDPRDAVAWNNRGLSLDNLGRFDEALRSYDRALELDPSLAIAWINNGTALCHLGRFDEALRSYDHALELDPHDAGAWNGKGNSIRALGRFDEALRCYDCALELDPQDAGAWNNKALCLDEMGRFYDAISCCDRALDIAPKEARAWNNKGISLRKLDRNDDALRCFERALELDPRRAKVWWNRATSLHMLGHDDEAVNCFDEALKLDPKYVIAWSDKGNSLNQLDRFAEAIPCFDKVLELDPKYPVAWFNKGAALHHLGRLHEAIDCYQRALDLAPRYRTVWSNKALAEEKLGRMTDAVHSYEQVILLGDANSESQVHHAQKKLSELRGRRNG